jgi:hypothetical protein
LPSGHIESHDVGLQKVRKNMAEVVNCKRYLFMKMLIQNRNATILNVQKMFKRVRIILILLLTSSGVYLEKANI